MIDTHSHIIPRVDDGSQSIEETVEMIKEAEKAGFSDIIVTPHYILNCYESESNNTTYWINGLSKILEEENINVKLHTGTEAYVCNEIDELIRESKVSTLARSKYLLMELPINANFKHLDDILFVLSTMGITTILAHPERYKEVHENFSKVEEYISKGCLIQCNYGSIIGLYGKKAQKTIKKMLKMNLVDFLGSDAHKKEDAYTVIDKAVKAIKKITTEEQFKKMTEENPTRVIKNISIT